MRSSEQHSGSPALALALFSLTSASLMSGCLSPIDLTGRRCPCDEGWVCEPIADECVREAGSDTGTRDVGATDGGERDAGVDGGGVDAPIDASSLDAGSDAPDAPSASTCPSEALLCDDFESSAATRIPPWGFNAGGPSRSTVRAFRGVASGHFEVSGSTSSEQSVGINLARSVSDVWVRFWAYVPSSSNRQNVTILLLGDATGPDYFNHSVVFNSAGMGMYNDVIDAYYPSRPFPSDTWTCVSFHAELAGSTGVLELFIDGESPLVGTGNTFFPTGPQVLALGITYIAPEQTDPFGIDYDDVAVTVDGTPLRCP